MTLRIPMIPCKSSAVLAFGYDAMSKTLAVRFISGNLHHFQKVPLDVYEELLKAESAGAFINKNVRGKFESIHQEEPKS